MKRFFIILILFLLKSNIYADTKVFNSIKIYGIDQNILYRTPTSEKSIMERYAWYFESKDTSVDFQYYNNHALKSTINQDIGIKMVFENNGNVIILYFARDDIPNIQHELNNLIQHVIK